ncbi:MAG: DUF488 domain-containing protein [Pirellulaceae bacterium]|nr:DUF488 domain-containing protein [Pirellulaceae bacterium]
MNERCVFTIGHSTHEMGRFLELLRSYGVTAVVDVRSQPASRLPHFCRDHLAAELRTVGIEYVFLGSELGVRRVERECYVDGRVSYERIARLASFQHGLDRIERGAATRVVTLLCAEKEPLECHRTILVARHLVGRGWNVKHILADGTAEDHIDGMRRLLRLRDIGRTLFEPNLTEEELFERAYEEQSRIIAYRDREEETDG